MSAPVPAMLTRMADTPRWAAGTWFAVGALLLVGFSALGFLAGQQRHGEGLAPVLWALGGISGVPMMLVGIIAKGVEAGTRASRQQ